MRRAPADTLLSTRLRALGFASAIASALAALTSCASTHAAPAATSPDPSQPFVVGALRVAAEGPCARLTVAAIGDRRVLVFGDTGYDLAGWLPGDELPAAQSIAVLTPAGAGFDPRLLAGLPRDARGYVPGSLEVGGERDASAWLLRVTTRYSPGGAGALFARESEGYRLGARGWGRADGGVVDRPSTTAGLPALPEAACGDDARFLPLASATTARGVLVAGRCDDTRIANPAEARLLVAHGRAGATSWAIEHVPGTENLDGIVNVAIAAATDDRAILVAYEPFLPPERRHSFAAAWDGRRWSPRDLGVPGGYVDVAYTAAGAILVAHGSGATRVDARGHVEPMGLPAPRFADGDRRDVYVHGVQAFGDEIWIDASYRVWPDRRRPPVWASAVFTNTSVPRTVICDAREAAEQALTEVE